LIVTGIDDPAAAVLASRDGNTPVSTNGDHRQPSNGQK
jgi:hypothetical protein